MGFKTDDIISYSIDAFGVYNKHFWFDTLPKLLDQHPFLEYHHRVKYYMIMLIKGGEGTVMVDNHKIKLDEQKILCVVPGSIFSLDIDRQAIGYAICFTDNFFSLRYNNNVLHQFQFLNNGSFSKRLSDFQYDKLCKVLDLLAVEYNSNKKSNDVVLRSYLNIILCELDRLERNNQFKVLQHSLKNEKVLLLRQYVEKHYKTKKKPSDYAKLLCVTPNYLNKVCKEETGTTVGDIIRQHIVIEAQRLLHYTNLTINEISSELGFDSASYFVTFFKKHTNVTPENFRKQS